MFPLDFHYEDVSRQDLLLKLNHANVREVPELSEIRLVPKVGTSDFIIKNGKLAMEIACGQKFRERKRGSIVKSFRSNPIFFNKEKGKKENGYGNHLARESSLQGCRMSHFLVRISTVIPLLDSRVEIRGNSIQVSLEAEFCEFASELEDHFEIFEVDFCFHYISIKSRLGTSPLVLLKLKLNRRQDLLPIPYPYLKVKDKVESL